MEPMEQESPASILHRSIERARRWEAAGAWAEAADLYAWLLERFPEEARQLGCLEAYQRCERTLRVEALWGEAEQAVAAGALDRAQSALQEIVRLQPDAARASRSARDWLAELRRQSAARRRGRVAGLAFLLIGVAVASCVVGLFLARWILGLVPVDGGGAASPPPGLSISPTPFSERSSVLLPISSPMLSPPIMPDRPLSAAPQRIRPLIRWGSHRIPMGMLLSPDRRWIAWPIGDTVEWLDPISLSTVRVITLPSPTSIIASAFSPDGQWLALGAEHGEIFLWSVAQQAVVRILRPDGGVLVESLAFSPDGIRLAAGAAGGTLYLWRFPEGSLERTIRLGALRIFDLVFVPPGDRLIAAASDGRAHVLDLTTGRELRTLPTGATWATALALHPEGELAAVGGTHGQVILWRVSDGAVVQTLQGHSGVVTSLAFTPDGTALISGATDRAVWRWTLPQGKGEVQFIHPVAWVDRVAILPDGRIGASFSDGTLMAFNSRGEPDGVIQRREAGMYVEALTFHPEGSLLAAGYADGTIRLWSVPERQLVKEWGGHALWIGGMAFSPEGGWLASAGADGWVRRWSIPEGQLLQEMQGDGEWLSNVVVGPEGRWVAVGGIGHRVHVFPSGPSAARLLEGIPRGLPIRTLQDWDYRSFLSLDRSGQWLASSGLLVDTEGRVFSAVFLWKGEDLSLAARFDLSGRGMAVSAFHPQVQRLAVGLGNQVWLLSVPEGESVFDVRLSPSIGIRSLAFSPDGELLFAGGIGGIVAIRAADGAVLQRLLDPSDTVNALAVSPDGRLLASGSEDGTIILWGVR